MTVLFASGSADITPSHRPVQLAGYGPGVTARQVSDPLECSVLVVFPGDGPPIAVVSIDTLYVGAGLRSSVLEKLGPSWDSDRLFLAATHTHNAPGLDPEKPLLGGFDGQYLAECSTAVARLIERTTYGVRRNGNLFADVRRYRVGINRRRRRLIRANRSGLEFNKVGMGPNPSGPIDDHLLTVVVRDTQGLPAAVLWNTACHPTSFPEADAVSAHFPGAVRAAIRGHFRDSHLPVLFLQGFSGDVRPPTPPESCSSPRRIADRIRLGKGFGPFPAKDYRQWCQRLSEQVLHGVSTTERVSATAMQVMRMEFPASDMVTGGDPNAAGSIHAFRLGDLTLFGVSAEPVSLYASWLRQQIPKGFVAPVGCIDRVWGYLPTKSMLGEGGYEARHFCPAFSVSQVADDCEGAFTRHALEALSAL